MAESPSSPRTATIIAAGSVLAIVGLFMARPAQFHRGPMPADDRNGLDVSLSASTFNLEGRRTFTIKALNDFDPACVRVTATVPELGFQQTFTRKELADGVGASLNPAKTGRYLMTFACGDRVVGSAAVSVVRPGGPLTMRNVRWVLSAGSVTYRDGSFVVPVMVGPEELRGKEWMPVPASQATRFSLRDKNGQLDGTPGLSIERNASISDPYRLPLPMGAGYVLVAHDPQTGKLSNELRVDWKSHGPALTLRATPSELTIYAAPISSGDASVYLAQDDRLLKPATPMTVAISHEPFLTSTPARTLTLTTAEPAATYTASAGTSARTTTVQLVQLDTGLTATINVRVLSTLLFLLTAAGTGLIGVTVAKGARLFQRKWLLVVLELGIAAACAFLLYAAILQGWLAGVGITGFTLSFQAAACIGLMGGFIGIGVFKAIAKLFKL